MIVGHINAHMDCYHTLDEAQALAKRLAKDNKNLNLATRGLLNNSTFFTCLYFRWEM